MHFSKFCGRLKIKYILFWTTYPNINICVLSVANSQSLTSFLKEIFASYGIFSPINVLVFFKFILPSSHQAIKAFPPPGRP